MNDDEKQLVKLGVDALFKPYSDLVYRLFGAAVDEMGETLWEEVTLRCDLRRAKVIGKIQAAIAEAQFEPQRIHDCIWIPALQSASLQDEELLQDAWANMCANDSDPRDINPVSSIFPDILRGLTSREVRFLDLLFKSTACTFKGSLVGWQHQYQSSRLLPNVIPHYSGPSSLSADEENEFLLMMEILIGLRILADNAQTPDGPYRFTHLGVSFVRACQPPAKS
jgi:hypothetical protein